MNTIERNILFYMLDLARARHAAGRHVAIIRTDDDNISLWEVDKLSSAKDMNAQHLFAKFDRLERRINARDLKKGILLKISLAFKFGLESVRSSARRYKIDKKTILNKKKSILEFSLAEDQYYRILSCLSDFYKEGERFPKGLYILKEKNFYDELKLGFHFTLPYNYIDEYIIYAKANDEKNQIDGVISPTPSHSSITKI